MCMPLGVEVAVKLVDMEKLERAEEAAGGLVRLSAVPSALSQGCVRTPVRRALHVMDPESLLSIISQPRRRDNPIVAVMV